MKEFLEFRRQQPDEAEKQQYNQYVKDVTPTHGLGSQMMKAFVTGGIICCMGQWIINYALSAGLDEEAAGSWCSLILVLISAVLTGFNIFPSIAKWAAQARWFRLPASPTVWRPRPSSTRRRARSSASAARFSPSPGR